MLMDSMFPEFIQVRKCVWDDEFNFQKNKSYLFYLILVEFLLETSFLSLIQVKCYFDICIKLEFMHRNERLKWKLTAGHFEDVSRSVFV